MPHLPSCWRRRLPGNSRAIVVGCTGTLDRCPSAGFVSLTEPTLESWLKQRALKNQLDGASRTFIVCEGEAVVGYYCLSAGSVSRNDVPGGIRRNMPEPISVVVLGRLAVDSRWMGQGIGRGMLKDAVMRTAGVAQQLGVRALLCHAISRDAKAFYIRHGFAESPLHPLTLLLPMRVNRRR